MQPWMAASSLALLLALAPPGAQAQHSPGVQQWSGNGEPQTTEPIRVAHSDWTLSWSTQDRGNIPGYLSIEVFNVDTRLPAGSVSSDIGGSGGTATLHTGPGTFYLLINGTNTNWSVQVADLN
jgi:hypothetical protein